VVGRGRGLRFANEPLLRGLVVAPLRRKEFQRDETTQTRITRGVDDTHAATAKLGEDLVLRDGSPDERIDNGSVHVWLFGYVWPLIITFGADEPGALSDVTEVRRTPGSDSSQPTFVRVKEAVGHD
jgi:hypothetical protein